MGLHAYLGALWRFRWLIPIALCAAVLVPLLMLYRPVWPAGLESRATTSYVTKTQLLVDSPSGPFLRTETSGAGRAIDSLTPESQPPAEEGSPNSSDTRSLVNAANLFPLLIESDEVVELRRELVGDVPGTVNATALFANEGANRFRPSVLPVMQVIAVAPDPASAFKLGQGTARAFTIWLGREQNRAKVPRRERIVVRQLRQPAAAEPTGGSGRGMPILAGLAVLGAFFGLVVALDRALPRVSVARSRASDFETVPSASVQSKAKPAMPTAKPAGPEPEPEPPTPTARPAERGAPAPESNHYSHSLERISDVMRRARTEGPSG